MAAGTDKTGVIVSHLGLDRSSQSLQLPEGAEDEDGGIATRRQEQRRKRSGEKEPREETTRSERRRREGRKEEAPRRDGAFCFVGERRRGRARANSQGKRQAGLPSSCVHKHSAPVKRRPWATMSSMVASWRRGAGQAACGVDCSGVEPRGCDGRSSQVTRWDRTSASITQIPQCLLSRDGWWSQRET